MAVRRWWDTYGNGWVLLGVVGLVGVGVSAGLGNLGIALLLVVVAPVPATVGTLRARRLAWADSLRVLRGLPLTEGQRRLFTGWFLFAAFIALGTVIGAVGGGLGAVL